eukprot:TRINITY_DN5016_c0_g1_i3.p2 TRINITY_DN5016_c0_g1~~TRINITY_DN5016_c0_g1_i3.p2  ORF type:complete len:123 (+),score=36.30 TRINITY_DN5016_c0_g1_i3:82-450(+)
MVVILYVFPVFSCYFFFFFFFNDTATTEIYTLHIVGSVRCVQETGSKGGHKSELGLRDNNSAYVSAILSKNCLLYTSDAADDMQCVDLGGRRIIKKKKKKKITRKNRKDIQYNYHESREYRR